MNSMDVEDHRENPQNKRKNSTKNFFKEKIKKMNLYTKITKNLSKH